QEKVPFFLGGDHSVTIPLVQGFESHGQPIHVIQVDAHPDLYFEYEGDRYSHACTAARLLEMRHVASVTQLGIRCMSSPQRQNAAQYRGRLFILTASQMGLEPIRLDHIPAGEPVYLTVDLDGIDPAFAPGVSHPVPGGLLSRQVLDLFHSFHWKLIGMDVVEVNPTQDINNQTSILAARILHEGMGVVDS
ncbi:MAG: arginase family protein, partial [Acidobacteriota bacterium]